MSFFYRSYLFDMIYYRYNLLLGKIGRLKNLFRGQIQLKNKEGDVD